MWRQVVSQGNFSIRGVPTVRDDSSSSGTVTRRLLRRGISFSGRERNCCFLNVGGKGFADVSAVSGLNFPDDGRALALIDWDQDGDLDLWCSNRSGPQVRFLRNDLATSNHFLTLRLVGNGTSTNRDAIGARVEVVVKSEAEEEQRAGGSSTLIKTVRAGDGFMSQSSKQLHFGLGDCSEIEKLVVRWPGGQAEEIIDVEVDQHYRVVQGSGSAVLVKPDSRNVPLQASELGPTKASDAAQVFFSSPAPLPKLQYELSSGETREVQPGSRQPLLINLWATWCRPCLVELQEFTSHEEELRRAGLEILALNVDSLDMETGEGEKPFLTEASILEKLEFPFLNGSATTRLVDVLQLVHDELFDRHRPLPVPTSLLLDSQRRLAAIYKGPVTVKRLLKDVRLLRSRAQQKRMAGVPFAGRWISPLQLPEHRTVIFVDRLIEERYADLASDLIHRYRDTLQTDPWYPGTLVNLGNVMLEKDRTQEAKRVFFSALKEQPEMAEPYFNLGLLAEKDGDTEQALSYFRRALEKNPALAAAHMRIALLVDQGDGSEAIEHLQKLVRLRPGSAVAQQQLGLALKRAGRQQESLPYLYKAAEIEPDDPMARLQLGLLLHEMGQVDEAIEQLRYLTRLQPEVASGHYVLGQVLEHAGDAQQARLHFEKALELKPDYDVVHIRLADLCHRGGESELALTHLRKAQRLLPDDLGVQNRLAWIMATHGDPSVRNGEEAVRWAEQVSKKSAAETPGTLDTLAAAYAAAGRFADAIATAEQARQLASSAKQDELAAKIEQRLQGYRKNEAYVAD